jgi:purine-binding chemotaxis protein CheW
MSTDKKVPQVQTSGQLSTFFVADLFFGVDVLDVQEVLRSQQMTPVPQASEMVEGLINLRGQIVTAIDMRRRLRLPPHAENQTPMNMVVRTSDGVVSLLVDEIGDVLDVDAVDYERSPSNLDLAARELIRGVYKLKDRVLLVLDTERAVDVGSDYSPRNDRIDAPPAKEQAASRDISSPVVHAITANPTGPALSQKSTKKGTRKTAVKETSVATRGVETELN